jgi:beta-galactosidase GanA
MIAKRERDTLDEALWRGVPLARLAALAGLNAPLGDAAAAQSMIQAYTLGEGRGVHLKYPAFVMAPRLAFRHRALTEFDYWMLLVGKALAWSAHRETPVAVSAAATAVRAGDSNRQTFTVVLRSGDARQVDAECRLRRGDGWTVPLGVQRLTLSANADTTCNVSLPAYLCADDHWVDVVVRTDGESVGAGALWFAPTSLEGIAEVSVDAESVERGQPVTVSVVTRGTLHAGDVVRIQLRDTYDRVLVRRDLPAVVGRDRYQAECVVPAQSSIFMRAEGALVRDGHGLEQREASFYAPDRRRGQFNFVQWAGRGDVLEYYAWQKLAEAGWKITLGGAEAMGAFDVTRIPYCTRLMETHNKEGIMQPVCWNDEPKVTEYVDSIVQKQVEVRKQGPFVYSLGDEGTTTGCCVHPACLDAYRQYLKRQYGSIEALNASWGSDYADFAAVDLLDHKDIMEGAAATQGKWARWYDRQAFSRANLAHFTGRFVDAFTAFDPHAITGFEGTGGFGDDFDLLLDTMSFWSPYPSIGDDILRSVADRSHIRANWMGYHKNADPLVNFSWRMVMKEMDSIWWWRYDGCGSWRGYISPILDFWPATEEVCREMAPVRDGLGDLLIRSRVQHSGVAIFYSLPSALCGKLGDNASFPGPKDTHTRWLRAIYDLGLDIRYVTRDVLLDNALIRDGYRVLVLPVSQAIGADEAAMIRRFVEAGGTVIADLRPGILDAHCKPLSTGVLDDLFGIRRGESAKAVPQTVALDIRLDDVPVKLPDGERRVDPAVQAAGATALAAAGDTPTMLYRTQGRGKALLLNFELPDRGADQHAFLDSLLRWAGAKPVVEVNAEGQVGTPGMEVRTWRNGNALVLGIWNEMDIRFYGEDGLAETQEGTEVTVRLPKPYVVFDLRTHQSLGSVERFVTSVKTARANFFALYDEDFGDVSITLEGEAAPGAMLTARIRLSRAAAGDAVVPATMWVEGPDGNSPPWNRQPVMLHNRQADVSVPVPWNAASGTWRVHVRELFSGRTAVADWSL